MAAATLMERVFGERLEISLEVAGDHHFDLRHLRNEQAERLLRLLLNTAGYRKQLLWRVQVQKKLACGPETKAITVVGSKAWCCYLKIKPGDNNTAHLCSLIMPAGFQSATVYETLKEVEERVNAAWRRGFEGDIVPADYTGDPSESNGTDHEAAAREAARMLFDSPLRGGLESVAGERRALLAVPLNGETIQEQWENPPVDPRLEHEREDIEQEEIEDDKGDENGANELSGWSLDPEKVRLTLLAIYEVGQEGKAKDVDGFVATLCDKLGWRGLRRRQIGGIFTALARRGHIYRIRDRSYSLGYGLTAEGFGLIRDLLPPDAVLPAAPALAPPTANGAALADPAHLAAALSEAAQGFATAYQKLQVNQARRAKLMAELKDLEAEAAVLSRVVANPEVQALLSKLLQLTGSSMAT